VKTATRKKVRGSNQKESQRFESFGSSPPKAVEDLLGLSDINIQKQGCPHFLVFDSPGNVASYLREVSGLAKIDKVVDLLSSKLRSNRQQLESVKSSLDDVKCKLEYLESIDLDTLESTLEEAERIQRDIDDIRDEFDSLAGLVVELKRLGEKDIILPVDVDDIVESVDSCSSEYSGLSEKIECLRNLIDGLKSIEDVVVLPDDLDSVISSLDEVRSCYEKTVDSVSVLFNLLDGLLSVNLSLCEVEEYIDDLHKEVVDLTKQLNVCPSCGQRLDDESKAVLLDSI